MRSRRSAALWIGAIGYAAAIFILSSQPVPAPAQETLVLFGDKALHGLEYAGLATLLTLAIASTPAPRIRSRASLIAFIAAVAYAVTDEGHQTLVPPRQGDAMDVAADALGALLAVVAYEGWRRWSSRGPTVSETSPR